MSTGWLPSIEGMIVRCSPAPVIARIRGLVQQDRVDVDAIDVPGRRRNPGIAVPSTTRVHAAVSSTAPHNSSGRVNLAICRTEMHLSGILQNSTRRAPANTPGNAGAM